jgi:hypothetical protein
MNVTVGCVAVKGFKDARQSDGTWKKVPDPWKSSWEWHVTFHEKTHGEHYFAAEGAHYRMIHALSACDRATLRLPEVRSGGVFVFNDEEDARAFYEIATAPPPRHEPPTQPTEVLEDDESSSSSFIVGKNGFKLPLGETPEQKLRRMRRRNKRFLDEHLYHVAEREAERKAYELKRLPWKLVTEQYERFFDRWLSLSSSQVVTTTLPPPAGVHATDS